MNEVLTPKVGDRVRLVNENGDEATITLKGLDLGIASSETNTFWLSRGWSVAEILERAYPPAGTFVKGVMAAGGAFAGVVEGGHVKAVDMRGDDYILLPYMIASWEVIS